MPAQPDEVDLIVRSWERERPDLDFAPLRVLSRVDRLSHQLDAARRAAFAEPGLEPWEFDVLASLRRAGAPFTLSPKTLLTQNLVSSGTMTNRIDRLVARGLVRRETDPNDGRGILVVMTAAGRDAVDAAISALLAAESQLLSAITEREQESLSILLRRLGVDSK
ncbi:MULTISPECIES: MarR family winged helix-turn-helix transcriptional regulator [Mycetocola]|uniref:MarR family transcriptional regulator n=1 Tax=Mycetocola lacteus TaxID=76637 RepID=A0A3L7AMN7_9MICO|nr:MULTISPECIES: MarR family transcriptional regulator [Mycetocola]RLP80920.1 MarR family transcriptional regulator [Mycetocola lacteus]RLP84705.1 MarR family transcriptional regulator [Mycetocola lacteus]